MFNFARKLFKTGEQGFAPILMVLLLLAGIAIATYLVLNRQIFKSNASGESVEFVNSENQLITQTNSPSVKVRLTAPSLLPGSPVPSPSAASSLTPLSNVLQYLNFSVTKASFNANGQKPPNGIYSYDITIKALPTSSLNLTNFTLKVKAKSNAVLLNADGGPKGVDEAVITIPNSQLGPDNILSPGESFNTTAQIQASEYTALVPELAADSPDIYSNLSANLTQQDMTFNFAYSGPVNKNGVLISPDPNFLTFGIAPVLQSTTSPVTYPAPKNNLKCGQTIYWKIFNATRAINSPAQSSVVNCTGSSAAVVTTSVDLAEDPNFTYNVKSFPYKESPLTAEYTFSNASAGQKLLYARFNVSNGTKISGQPFPAEIQLLPSPSAPAKKILLLIHNPVLENKGGQKVSQFMGWQDPDQIVNTMINNLKANSHGQANYQIAERIEMNDYPVKADGFKYTDDSFENCLTTLYSGQSGCHQPDHVNDLAMINSVDACGKLNSGAIDELWVIGAPFFGYWESNLAGPGAFYYNSGPTTGSSCTKLLPIMGLNYERPDQVLHSYEHRIEATMTNLYGSWQENRTQFSWDKFGLVKSQSPNYSYSGCGSVHFPPNGLQDYDYSNQSSVNSNCDDFANYPNLSDPVSAAKPINCTAWGCTDQGYYKWWMSKIPYFSGTGPDGKLNNWWTYILDPGQTIPPPGTFSALSANLSANQAVFNFAFSQSASNFTVDVSQTQDLSFGLYYNFTSGSSSPITENNTQKMTQYVCGATLYWRITANPSGIQSPIQTATIICPQSSPTPSPSPNNPNGFIMNPASGIQRLTVQVGGQVKLVNLTGAGAVGFQAKWDPQPPISGLSISPSAQFFSGATPVSVNAIVLSTVSPGTYISNFTVSNIENPALKTTLPIVLTVIP